MVTSRAGLASVVVLALVVSAGAVRAAEPPRCAAGDPTTIKVEGVPAVCGKVAASPSVYTYQGIPYAAPPIGDRRWQPPQPIPWPPPSAVQRVAFGPKCAQPGLVHHVGSEDCLYLNVWTPKNAINGARKLPVMVFVHGGAFIVGSGGSPIYEGSKLANSGVVVVTLNYRLGALGFLVGDSHGSGPIVGNYGLLDQQAAMTWVQRNIFAFGGDPDRVTLFGESAGAISVGLHYFSVPSSQPLFAAALMESNPLGVVYKSSTDARPSGDAFLAELCKVFNEWHLLEKCPHHKGWLRGITTQQIVHAQRKVGAATTSFSPTLPWAPVVDGNVVTGQPYAGYAPGVTSRKPLGFGVNGNEGVLFAALDYQLDKKPFTPAQYDANLEQLFGADGKKKILAHPRYDPAKVGDPGYYNDVAAAFANVATDYVFACGNVAAANAAVAAANAAPVFGYRFTQPPFFDLYNKDGFEEDHGACEPKTGNVCHGNELPYVFGNLEAVSWWPWYEPRATDPALAKAMTAAWAAFAVNPKAPVGWRPYKPSQPGGKQVVQWNGSDHKPVDLDAEANCSSLWLGTPPYKR